MIVDSSALLAIILQEPEEETFLRAVASAVGTRMSVASYFEVALKLDGAEAGFPDPILDKTIERLGISLMPVTVEHSRLARVANLQYGRRQPAKLNFGDCLTYALAKASGEPLLFKGNDFSQTDLRRVAIDADEDDHGRH